MKKVRVRELQDWPPQPGGAYSPGAVIPVGGEALVSEVFPVSDKILTFRGTFDKDSHSYHYKADTHKIALQLHEIVSKNVGKTVLSLGEFEIEV